MSFQRSRRLLGVCYIVVKVSHCWMLGKFPKHCDVFGKWSQTTGAFPLGVLQVSLLVVMEIGLFPLICGWWLDVCSLVSQKLC